MSCVKSAGRSDLVIGLDDEDVSRRDQLLAAEILAEISVELLSP